MKEPMKTKSSLLAGLTLYSMALCGSPCTLPIPPRRNPTPFHRRGRSAAGTGCYGKDYIKSPNIDRIASAGNGFQSRLLPAGRVFADALQPDDRHRLTRPRYGNLVTHFRDALPNVVTLGQHFKQNGYFVQGMARFIHGKPLDDPPRGPCVADAQGRKVCLAGNVKLDARQYEGEPDGEASRKSKKKSKKSPASTADGRPRPDQTPRRHLKAPTCRTTHFRTERWPNWPSPRCRR